MRTSTRLFNLVLVGMSFAMTGPSFAEQELQSLRWKARVLVVCAPSQQTPAFRDQQTLLSADPKGLTERDLHLIEITDGARPDLRRELSLPNGEFQVVLLGKDGGVKLRQSEPVSLESLYGIIDAMPMRQREMKQD